MTQPTDIYGNPAPPPPRRIVSFGIEPTVAVVGTGVNTVVQVFTITLLMLAERSIITLTPGGLAAILAAVVLGSIAGYATLLPWMFAARKRLVVAGYEAPANWQVWAAWIIPIYNLWGPYQVMQLLRVRVRGGATWSPKAWWSGWIAFIVLDRLYNTLENASTLSTVVLVASMVAIVVAYAGLVAIIRDVTASFRANAPPDAAPGQY